MKLNIMKNQIQFIVILLLTAACLFLLKRCDEEQDLKKSSIRALNEKTTYFKNKLG